MSDHSAIDPPDLSHGNGLIETKANGKPAPEDTTALLDSVAVAPVLDLMSEALSSPEEFGGSGIASPTAFAVRKPDKDEWFRVHPSFRPDFFLYERKVGNRTVVYLVRKPFVPLFGKAAKPCTLRLCVNVQGTRSSGPCKHALDGFGQSWAESRAAVGTGGGAAVDRHRGGRWGVTPSFCPTGRTSSRAEVAGRHAE